MKHIILLGDSIFDNAAYVKGGPDVIHQLRAKLPVGWKATLNAVDGNVVQNVYSQLARLPREASHIVLSVGGNDALGHAGILGESARSAAEVLNRLADVSEDFQQQYHAMLDEILSHRLPTAICTIYYPRLPERQSQRIAVAALTIFNDVIVREAFMAGVPLLDLRLICNEDADYANEIEPSVIGGEKISDAIMKLLAEHDFDSHRTEVFIE
jgi:lysophospholipase L1-like esterase